jgi:hypothetical protein
MLVALAAVGVLAYAVNAQAALIPTTTKTANAAARSIDRVGGPEARNDCTAPFGPVAILSGGLPAVPFVGDNTGGIDDNDATEDPALCFGSGYGAGNGGADDTWEFTVDTCGVYTFDTGCTPALGGFMAGDTSLQVRQGPVCSTSTIIACNGDACGSFNSSASQQLAPGVTYWLIVDSYSPAYEGAYGVGVGFAAPPVPCCNVDADCDDGLFCTGVETCDVAAHVCNPNPGNPCVAPTGVCQEATDTCVGCSTDADCTNPALPFCFGGACVRCLVDADCADAKFCNGVETCTPGHTCAAGPGNPCLATPQCDYCWDGVCSLTGNKCNASNRSSAGTANLDCNIFFAGAGNVCVPDLAQGHCEVNDCHVYRTDWDAFFGPGHDPGELLADDVTLDPAPAGRNLVSYEFLILCRNGVNGVVVGGGDPFDVTTELWSADPAPGPNQGSPLAPIAGTQCTITGEVCGNGITGNQQRTSRNLIKCEPNGGLPTGVFLPDSVPGGIDFWIVYSTTTSQHGPTIAGDPPLSQGTIVGNSADLHGTSTDGGLSWGFFNYGGGGQTANFGFANVCTEVVGPCCTDVPGADHTPGAFPSTADGDDGVCGLLSSAACALAGGTYLGDSTCDNPRFCDDPDDDGDGVRNDCDNCPDDATKVGPGECGCGVPDTDNDSDGVADCDDLCDSDPGKIDPGVCGCGVPDDDTDHDGTEDCIDGCPTDPNKTAPGICGCGVAETGDSDLDGYLDCVDQCPGVDDDVFFPGCVGAIPTVNQWGLIVLGLLLLAGAKVYFGRRTSVA